MIGWVVNDRLTAIPGTRTFWHNLLEWFPFLVDMTFGYTHFSSLAMKIETAMVTLGVPNIIIRNASYFRRITTPPSVRTISFMQDPIGDIVQQEQVCNSSSLVVYNSEYTRTQYAGLVHVPHTVIPIGTDFTLFRPLHNKEELRQKYNIPSDSILFIGANSDIKGFMTILDLITNTEYNFCLVMKDDFELIHPRVRVFNRVQHNDLVEIINCCAFLLCTSKVETLHLAGIEAAACGLPILATNVGAYFGLSDGQWGMHYSDPWDISAMFMQLSKFDPRMYFLSKGFDLDGCRSKWAEIV